MVVGAIDIGGTKTITAILSDSGEILNSIQFPTVSSDWQNHFEITSNHFKVCAEKYMGNIVGVGINVPGMTDMARGSLIYAPHQNWRNVPVRDYFRQSLSMEHIEVENDVNSCAIGEMLFGGGGTDFLWITISTGNGGAIVANSKLIRGINNCAGEFGHLKVEYENPRKCSCGQFGCLESQSSGTAIGEIFIEQLSYNKALLSFVEEAERTIPEFKRDAFGLSILAKKGSDTALEIFKTAGKYLGRAISYGLNIANPERVYVGGGVAKSLPLMLPQIYEEIEKNVIHGAKNVEILESKLGYNAALLGAGALVLNK